MKTLSHFFVFILFCFVNNIMFATNYYVATTGNDDNSGAINAPFKSIQHAVDIVNGGDVIYVFGGVYTEKIVFENAANSGQNSAIITLTNVEGETPVIDGASLDVSGREGLITVKNASYIKITGFEFQNFQATGSSTPCGFYMEGTCTQVEFSNNKVHDIKNNDTCNQNDGSICYVGAHAIGVFGTTLAGITDVVFDNNEVYDNILMSSEAFVINGNVNGFIQTNNYVHDNNNIGFDYIGFENECSSCGETDRVRNGVVRGNISENNLSNRNNPWYGDEASAGGFYVDGGEDILFENNISFGNNIGIEVASEHDGKDTQNIIIRNNYIYNNTEVGISIGGSVANASAINISVINNTFYKNHGWGSEIVFQSRVHDSNIMNNIFYADNTGAFESYNPSTNSNNNWSNNLYYNGTAAGGSVSTADPMLKNPSSGDLDLQADSPAISLGLNTAIDISDVDIKGNKRIADETVDIGAHEYNSFTLTIDNAEVSVKAIEVYPNPFYNELYIDVTEVLEDVKSIRIINIQGREIISQKINSSKILLNNFDSLQSGFYVLEVLNNGSEVISKTKIIKK